MAGIKWFIHSYIKLKRSRIVSFVCVIRNPALVQCIPCWEISPPDAYRRPSTVFEPGGKNVDIRRAQQKAIQMENDQKKRMRLKWLARLHTTWLATVNESKFHALNTFSFTHTLHVLALIVCVVVVRVRVIVSSFCRVVAGGPIAPTTEPVFLVHLSNPFRCLLLYVARIQRPIMQKAHMNKTICTTLLDARVGFPCFVQTMQFNARCTRQSWCLRIMAQFALCMSTTDLIRMSMSMIAIIDVRTYGDNASKFIVFIANIQQIVLRIMCICFEWISLLIAPTTSV